MALNIMTRDDLFMREGVIYGAPSALAALAERWGRPRGYWRSDGDYIHKRLPVGNIVASGWTHFFEVFEDDITAWIILNPEELTSC